MNKINNCLMIGSNVCGLNGELFLHTDINYMLFGTTKCRKSLHFDCSCLLLIFSYIDLGMSSLAL